MQQEKLCRVRNGLISTAALGLYMTLRFLFMGKWTWRTWRVRISILVIHLAWADTDKSPSEAWPKLIDKNRYRSSHRAKQSFNVIHQWLVGPGRSQCSWYCPVQPSMACSDYNSQCEQRTWQRSTALAAHSRVLTSKNCSVCWTMTIWWNQSF